MAGLVLPVAVGASYAVALGILVGLAGAAVAGSLWRPPLSVPLVCFAYTAGGLAGTWSLASRGASLTVLPLLAVLVAVAALRLPSAAALGVLLVGAEAAAVGSAHGLAVEQVGACLLPVAAAAVVSSRLVRCRPRPRSPAPLAAALDRVLRGLRPRAVTVAGPVAAGQPG